MTSRLDNSTFNIIVIDWQNGTDINLSVYDAIIIAGRPGATDSGTYDDPEFLDFLKNLSVNDYKVLAIHGRNLDAWGWGYSTSVGVIQHVNQTIILENHTITDDLPDKVDPYDENCTTVTPGLIRIKKNETTLFPIAKSTLHFNHIISLAEPNTTLLFNFTSKERMVHFGVSYSKCWNLEGEKLFRESVYWLLYGKDIDDDGVEDKDDNCPITPNGPDLGTCIGGFNGGDQCHTSLECDLGFCSKNQEDADNDGKGDVCEAPVAYTVATSTLEDTSTQLGLDCVDPDNEPIQFEIVTNTSNGVLTGNASLRYYMPNLDYNGIDNFTYKCTDGFVESNIAYGFITVIPVNDAPEAYSVATSTYEDASGTIQLDCFDVDGDNLTYTVATTTVSGMLVVNNDTGAGVYTPDPDFNGIDNFTYFCDDGNLISNSASGTITVLPVNDAPIANNTKDVTIEDINVTIELNCTDIDGDNLTYIIASSTAHGDLNIDNDTGVGTYSPDQDYFGLDNFTYFCDDGDLLSNVASGTIMILGINDAPIVRDNIYYVDEDSFLDEPAPGVLGNDYDADPDNLTAILDSTTLNGLLNLLGNGSFNYTPDADFNGNDTFTYVANDGIFNSSTATVTIVVRPVNDPPVVQNVTLTTGYVGDLLIANCTATDIDNDLGDLIYYYMFQNMNHSPNLVQNWSTNNTYLVQQSDAHENIRVTCIASDGEDNSTNNKKRTVTILNSVPDANDVNTTTDEDNSVDIVLNCTDVDGDNLTYTVASTTVNGILVINSSTGIGNYTPNQDYNGTDNFTYYCNDGFDDSSLANGEITINEVKDAPVAYDDVEITPEDTVLNIQLNCTDVDSTEIYYFVASTTVHGTLVIDNSTGAGTYTPDQDYNGLDNFTFYCDDLDPVSNIAQVNITVTPINDAPVAYDVDENVTEDNSTAITLNCTDVDGPSLVYIIATTTVNGILDINSTTGVGTYTPDGNFSGQDSFTYYCNDSLNTSNIADGTIDVIGVNDPPVAHPVPPLMLVMNEDIGGEIQLNCTDSDGDNVTYEITETTTKGNLDLDPASGLCNYTPQPDYNGDDNFTYRCTDNQSFSNSENVTIIITAVDDVPVAYNVATSTLENTPTNITLNCSDVDGDLLVYYIASPTVYGSLTYNSLTGQARYTPVANFTGGDEFLYYCNDPDNDSNIAVASITVLEVVCNTNANCGSVSSDNFCDSLVYRTNTTTPTCQNAGTAASYCEDVSVLTVNDTCNNICDDALGCDYTECSDGEDNDSDTFIDFPADPGCDNYTDDNETIPITCDTNLDCGIISVDTWCDNKIYVTATTTPTCMNASTEFSYCSNVTVTSNETCNYICDDSLGCDYTECSDGDDNDNDTYVDFPLDLGCDNYVDDDESDGFVRCDTNADCGAQFADNYCDNLSYMTNTTTPTCNLAGTEHSYCTNESLQTLNDSCNYICDNALGCDYTECSDGDDNDNDTDVDYPVDLGCDDYYDNDESDGFVRCDTNLDCGAPSEFSYCDNLSHFTNSTTPTCNLAGTEHSYCTNETVETLNDVCNNICDDVLGCDFTECSDGDDNDNDTDVDFPNDLGCDDYYDNDESDGFVRCDTNFDCGAPLTLGQCECIDNCFQGVAFVSNTTTPTCNQAGTEHSYCTNETVEDNETCDYICDDGKGCDYTECTDGADNDNDTFIDYPNDLGCQHYFDDDESDGFVECDTDLDCGTPSAVSYCDNNLYFTNTTTPTCNQAGTEQSFCTDESSVSADSCNYICDNSSGCDYTQCSDSQDNDGDNLTDYPTDPECDSYYDDSEAPGVITCSSDLECGTPTTAKYCDGLIYVTNDTTPTCYNSGTETSYCDDVTVLSDEICSNICDDSLGCDYTECSDGDDNDNDTFIDYPNDLGCNDYYDDDESDGSVACGTNVDCGTPFATQYCDGLTFAINTTVPTCNNPGTELSFCSNDTDTVETGCNLICSSYSGCDYTECSDGVDNDNDTFVDYPTDLGCVDYLDNSEGDGVVTCYNNTDCGAAATIGYCDNLTFMANMTVPTCFEPGTEYSYCADVLSSGNLTCNMLCDDIFGCDYTECSDGIDNDNDGYIDYPFDTGCTSYDDNSEAKVVIPVPVVEKLDADMVIERVSISGEGLVAVGDIVTFFFEFRNRGDIDLDNVRAQVGIPELGIVRRFGPVDVNKGTTKTGQLSMFIPFGTLPGEYLARITIYDEETKRVQHRYIFVYE